MGLTHTGLRESRICIVRSFSHAGRQTGQVKSVRHYVAGPTTQSYGVERFEQYGRKQCRISDIDQNILLLSLAPKSRTSRLAIIIVALS